MKASNFLVLSLIIFLFASCSSVRVSSDYQKQTNFQDYKTYKIAKQDKEFPIGVNPINQQRIEAAIITNMEERKYMIANVDPDLLVSYYVTINTEQAIDTYTRYYGYRYRGLVVTDVDVREYKEGTLIIDLVDNKSQEVVWHGKATGTVSENMKNVEEKINEAVDAIFQEYFAKSKLASY